MKTDLDWRIQAKVSTALSWKTRLEIWYSEANQEYWVNLTLNLDWSWNCVAIDDEPLRPWIGEQVHWAKLLFLNIDRQVFWRHRALESYQSKRRCQLIFYGYPNAGLIWNGAWQGQSLDGKKNKSEAHSNHFLRTKLLISFAIRRIKSDAIWIICWKPTVTRNF